MTITVDPPAEAEGKRNRCEPPQALPCFVVPTGHEITAGGKKLVGSAQKWSRGGFLQHGSILLALDSRLWRQTTRLSPATELGAVSLEALAGKEMVKDDLIQALDGAFREFFGEPATSSSLTPKEEEMAHLLAEKKYSSTSWNVEREARDTL
jgi:lipoate-protein ligase A